MTEGYFIMVPEVVTKATVERLIHDIKEITRNPLHANGIYYNHDAEKMLEGHALIIGPPNTPYFGGYYFFHFQFPTNYPHSPPTVTYLTNDGCTRFNPNLYRNGKVCISVLNTWAGEPWDGTQSISTVLLSLCSILNETPLLNEPSITKTHADYNRYTESIIYKNLSVAVCDILNEKYVAKESSQYREIIREKFLENYKFFKNKVEEKIKIYPKSTELATTLYNMNICINYPDLKIRLKSLHKKLK